MPNQNIMRGGLYLLKGLGASYDIKRQFGQYAIYHELDGFIARVKTQRQVRNEVRHHSVYGKMSELVTHTRGEGRE